MIDLKFSEIVKINNNLLNELSGSYTIGIVSNIIVTQLKPILEYDLRKKGIPAMCTIGDYDNIMQDVTHLNKSNAVLIYWELANLIDGFQYKSNLLNPDHTNEYITRFKSEIDYVFTQLKSTPLVLINKFSTLAFNHYFIEYNNFDYICDTLNNYIKEKAASNMVIIDIGKIISKLSIEKSVDFRDYYSSKALYTINFFKNYVAFISPVIGAINGKRKKAIIFDCDNTLWEGIIGEDGVDGIKMSSSSHKGVIYEEIQFIAKELARNGVLVGLNSKNNLNDVEEVLKIHPDISLKDDEIVIKKINWEEKVANLENISKELNLGIDSLVFVDDSDFEINLVNQFQPEVTTIQVPNERYLYPSKLREKFNLFYTKDYTKEDKNRVAMYQQEKLRVDEKVNFKSIEQYLESLGLGIKIHIDDLELVNRTAQLTQKTNQFNLTTKRYTENEIRSFMLSEEHMVFSLGVYDKYGDYGITGVVIIDIVGSLGKIDTLLLSCRVLGRNIELILNDVVVENLLKKGIKKVSGHYIKTLKNEQVEMLYDKLNFTPTKSDGEIKEYLINIEDYTPHSLNYITKNYA